MVVMVMVVVYAVIYQSISVLTNGIENESDFLTNMSILSDPPLVKAPQLSLISILFLVVLVGAILCIFNIFETIYH